MSVDTDSLIARWNEAASYGSRGAVRAAGHGLLLELLTATERAQAAEAQRDMLAEALRFIAGEHGIHRKAVARAALAGVGTIPDGMFACHLCDVRACVNPKHIFVGTQSDNMQDCADKERLAFQRGMARKGEDHPQAKLTEQDVVGIRQMLLDGSSQREVADAFGVHQRTIWRIARRKLWASVE